MPPGPHRRRGHLPSRWLILALLALSGCSSIGDLGEVKPQLVSDDIHDWVGRDAARHAGAPVSTAVLTDDERALRDLAFPLIEPPYDRQRWDAILYECGTSPNLKRELWTADRTAYYANLLATPHRSPAARYNQLVDDIRNDIVRIPPFIAATHRVMDLDRLRSQSLQSVADLSVPERLNAQARMGENSLTIAWVQHALQERYASYRFALEHLSVDQPNPAAVDVSQVLAQLQQELAGAEMAPPRYAVLAPPLVTGGIAAAKP